MSSGAKTILACKLRQRRIDFEDELVIPNQVIGKKKITVRVPDTLDPGNASVL